MDARRTDRVISELARGQSRVMSRRQLLERDVSGQSIKGRVARGLLTPRYRGVYQHGSAPLDARGELAAALLRAGDGSWVAGFTAAGVRDLATLRLDRIELSSPNHVREPELLIHRPRDVPTLGRDVDLVRGLRVSTVPYLLLEVADRSSVGQLEWMITLAVRSKQFDPAGIEAVLAAHPRHRGIATLKRALMDYRSYADTKSRLEREFDHWLRHFPDISRPEGNQYIDGWEVDRVWPQWRLCIEIDGRPWHIAVQDRDKDHVKDTALQLLGWRIIRIGDRRWRTGRNLILESIRGFRDGTPLAA